ncbi:hypothetical protein [Brenneria izbisi]|uniref:Uncharacterized protein n=1 Tax=Brenneria izbisi TaxID=2939450 RepID=A0AA42C1G2_9GAMM|nr:hypothetical protein [Brenneria izbisi]MCV9879142.1 hypothetical protein [Brenneria izbisi]MCV9882824.1 hypothetical protein [Brenneria izbisi]
MNDQDVEKELLENGFTENDISHMRKIISRGGDSEETLQSLTHTLRARFHNGCFLFVIIITVFIINFIFNTPADLIETLVYLFFMIFSLFIVYYIGPINLAYKSYSYLKGKDKMG